LLEYAVRLLHGTLAILAAMLGVFLARHHPLVPRLLVWVVVAWGLAVCLRPAIWVFVLPAALPIAGFSAWTGWIGVEEFDLLALGAASGCNARMALQGVGWCCQTRTSEPVPAPAALLRPAPQNLPGRRTRRPGVRAEIPLTACQSPFPNRVPPAPRDAAAARDPFRFAWIGLAALAASSVLAMVRGLADADGLDLGWFQAYEDPLNSLRIGKSLLLALLLLPSLRSLQQAAPALVVRRLSAGMATGLGLVSLVVLCERAAYPGMLDFSTPYRTTALFWEMHVGGAALDVFLVLTVPFAVHALVQARNPWRWVLAAALAVAAGYTCLTTFSRGVYLGVGLALGVLACLLPGRRRQRSWPPAATGYDLRGDAPQPERWRVWGNRVLVVLLVCEGAAVLGLGDFMSTRLAAGERDLGGRLQHWREGLSLLRTPSEFLLGRGLGRFPTNYSQAVAGRGLPGHLQIVDDPEESYLRLFGPAPGVRLSGAFELLQRVPLVNGNYTLNFDLRAPRFARVSVGVCQQHLLYVAACTRQVVVVTDGEARWRHFSLPLDFRSELPDRRWVPALGFLAVHLEGGADFVDVDNLGLLDGRGRQLLANGSFTSGLGQWYFAARHYFLPWHVDNLFLEVLIDQGAVGLSLLLTLLAMAFARLLWGRGREHVLAPYLLAALSGCLAVAVFSNVLDMPRSAFLFYLLLCSALFLDGHPPDAPSNPRSGSLKAPRKAPHAV
jgi:hypothetical protein